MPIMGVDAYYGGRGFIGLEWMPNTSVKKKDKHKFIQTFISNSKNYKKLKFKKIVSIRAGTVK
jgi:hypothetical protein